MTIERTRPLIFTARFLLQGVLCCKDLKQAREVLPDLTQEQFDGLKGGTMHLTGDTAVGVNIVMPAATAEGGTT